MMILNNKLFKTSILVSLLSLTAQPLFAQPTPSTSDKCASLTQRDSSCKQRAGQFSGPAGNGSVTLEDGSKGLKKRDTAFSNVLKCSEITTVPGVPGVIAGQCSGGTIDGGVPVTDPDETNSCVAWGANDAPLPLIYNTDSSTGTGVALFGISTGGGFLGLASNESPTLGCTISGLGSAAGPYAQNPNCSPWVPAAYPNLLIGSTFMTCSAVTGVSGSLRCNYGSGTGYVKPKSGAQHPSVNHNLHGAMIACEKKTLTNDMPFGEGLRLKDYSPCSTADANCAASPIFYGGGDGG